nr:uncharacterized protein LOC123278129 [Equus asinus]
MSGRVPDTGAVNSNLPLGTAVRGWAFSEWSLISRLLFWWTVFSCSQEAQWSPPPQNRAPSQHFDPGGRQLRGHPGDHHLQSEATQGSADLRRPGKPWKLTLGQTECCCPLTVKATAHCAGWQHTGPGQVTQHIHEGHHTVEGVQKAFWQVAPSIWNLLNPILRTQIFVGQQESSKLGCSPYEGLIISGSLLFLKCGCSESHSKFLGRGLPKRQSQ